MAVTRLRHKDIKDYRAKAVKGQKGRCPLCGLELLYEDSVLDHCHDTGYIRSALHRSCNAAEGRVKEWAGKRSRGDDPELWLKNLLKYWRKDYSKNPLHPTHGKPRRRRRRIRNDRKRSR